MNGIQYLKGYLKIDLNRSILFHVRKFQHKCSDIECDTKLCTSLYCASHHSNHNCYGINIM